jgi:hypothetical protein
MVGFCPPLVKILNADDISASSHANSVLRTEHGLCPNLGIPFWTALCLNLKLNLNQHTRNHATAIPNPEDVILVLHSFNSALHLRLSHSHKHNEAFSGYD